MYISDMNLRANFLPERFILKITWTFFWCVDVRQKVTFMSKWFITQVTGNFFDTFILFSLNNCFTGGWAVAIVAIDTFMYSGNMQQKAILTPIRFIT